MGSCLQGGGQARIGAARRLGSLRLGSLRLGFPRLGSLRLGLTAMALAASGFAHAQSVLDVAGPKGCDAGERTVRFIHSYVEEGHPIGEAAARLAAQVNRELDGRVCMTVFANGEKAGEGQELDALLRGEAEIAAPPVSAFERYTRAFDIFDLPFLFRDQASAEWFQNSGPGQRLRRELKGSGLLGLGFWNAGMKQFAAVRPLLAPADAKGLRIRVRDSAVLKASMRRLGARPVVIAFGDLREALEKGRAQGEEDSWANIYSQRFFELQNGVTESNHGVLAHLVVTTEGLWDSLPLWDRRDLRRLLIRASARANANARKIEGKAREALQRKGVEIRRLTAEQRAEWVSILRPVWAQFADQIGQGYIEAAVTANQ